MEDPTYEWKQPINFYGKVIDGNGDPVSGAIVDFTWNDLSPEGTSESQTASDNSGNFSLLEKMGKRLYVQVHKEGYYTSKRSGVAFEYANPADGLFTPDPNRPVIFHLRKKGLGVAVVTSEVGFRKHLGVVAPLDDTPVGVDLFQKKTAPWSAGQLIIRQKKPAYENWKGATEWTFRMEIPDGGFVEHHDEFPFEAPETGYEPVVQFDFQAGQPDWATAIQKDYYVKFGNPPRYGRLHLETEITMAGARLTYAINPDGSRNLEPK